MKTPYLLLMVSSLIAVTACGPKPKESTDKVNTSGIAPYVDVLSDGAVTRVRVDLRFGQDRDGTQLYLAEEDTLSATDGEISKNLSRDLFEGETVYESEFPARDTATTYTLSLWREKEVDAPDSYVKLPAPIVLISSESPQYDYDVTDFLKIAWEVVEDDLTNEIKLDWNPVCSGQGGKHIFTREYNLHQSTEDDGAYGYYIENLMEELIDEFDQDDWTYCDIELTLSRETRGHMDPAFTYGEITARQVSVVRFGIKAE